ncbi:hypothetical protein BLNAU_6913 [Blattamonas nauphoetae]|uniref:Uncharacterized protein n=1 Tax=Blattamonas nauphoetae TaxID=2049346 RepID=A0ABQ9Y3G2_9EUKA|nr:hypothetical protein BLNAU_6913 [Blattamonas nauphoetae]
MRGALSLMLEKSDSSMRDDLALVDSTEMKGREDFRDNPDAFIRVSRTEPADSPTSDTPTPQDADSSLIVTLSASNNPVPMMHEICESPDTTSNDGNARVR